MTSAGRRRKHSHDGGIAAQLAQACLPGRGPSSRTVRALAYTESLDAARSPVPSAPLGGRGGPRE